MTEVETILYKGSCHCGAIKWTVRAPKILNAIQCNCTICNKKQNHHFIVTMDNFELLQGSDDLTVYQFNKGVAQHKFCKHCGVQSFYHPRSNPGAVAIMPHCIDEPKPEVKWSYFDGQNWETTMETKAPNAFE